MRRISSKKLAELKQEDDAVRIISKRKLPKKETEQKSGVDARVLTEIFLKACDYMIKAFENHKPPTVIVPEIMIPPPPANKQVRSIEITGITRNRQNRIEGVKMNVQYED